MSANNDYLSADDFLAGVIAAPVDFEVPDVGRVQVRGLTYGETVAIQAQHRGDNAALLLAAVRCGLVRPELSAEQRARLEEAQPGTIIAIGNRVMELSGMGNEETAKN